MTIQQAIITLIAAIISGVLATVVTITLNAFHETIRLKQSLVDDIFGYKYQLTTTNQNSSIDIYSQGFCRAMNRVPIVFYNDKKVLDAYDKVYDTLSIVDVGERQGKSDEAFIVFLKELCISAHIKCNNWNDSRFIRVFKLEK